MKMLLIHTCGVQGSVALADETCEPPVIRMEKLAPRTFSEGLLPAIRRLLEAAAWKVQQLDAVAVVSGPGSFTGVRTGMSVGKGVCEALGIRLVAVSRLALLAVGDGLRYAVLDAGRGQFYVGLYVDGVPRWERLMERDALWTEAQGSAGVVVVCEDAVAAAFDGLAGLEQVAEPEAAAALPLALARLRLGHNDVLGDANYVRWTDGEIFARPERSG